MEKQTIRSFCVSIGDGTAVYRLGTHLVRLARLGTAPLSHFEIS
jgi:hypothetical protein